MHFSWLNMTEYKHISMLHHSCYRYYSIEGDRKLDRDSHSHSRNNLIGRTCENVIHEWILSKRRGSLVTDLLSKKRELFHTCYL